MQAVIDPLLARMGPEVVQGQKQAAAELRQWVAGRRAVLLADLQGGPREWRQPRKASFCVDLAGEVEGSFATSYGTNRAPDIYRTGGGTFAGVYRGVPVAVRRVGSWAGHDKNAQSDPWAVVDLSAEATNGSTYNIWLGVNPALFKDGATLRFDEDVAWGGLGQWNPQTRQWTYFGGFVGGEIRLDKAGLASGTTVRGRFAARVIKW
jgi:hypothetical protein